MTLTTDTPTVPARGLTPGLAAALGTVSVRDDGCQATVAGRTLSADSPRDLRGRLTNALYEELHAGRDGKARDTDTPPRRSLRDPALERRLAAAVPHDRTPARGLLIEVLRGDTEGDTSGDQLIVRLPEVTARVPADRLLTPGTPEPGQTVELSLEAARPALSPGFFYVMGSRALPRPTGAVRRIFLHAADADGAVVLWGAALTALERAEARYHAKVLSDPQDYPRRDGIVVYLHGDHVPGEQAVVRAVASLPGKGAETSVFTERLAPGVAASWDPEDPRPGQDGMSFGQHRAFALATALIDHALSRDAAAGTREDHIVRSFLEAGIDPWRPDRNLTSPSSAHHVSGS
ncbi:T3SS effector HopA1 family protein [Streptomyces aureoversilis]|uniref:T3SS effector HopA1 family protein n=1 Tax=Streptomyces aureoversilis TaxID=67277 RepID=A0ABW0A776_9ACTN